MLSLEAAAILNYKYVQTCVSVDNAASKYVESPGVASTGDIYYIHVTVFLSLAA